MPGCVNTIRESTTQSGAATHDPIGQATVNITTVRPLPSGLCTGEVFTRKSGFMKNTTDILHLQQERDDCIIIMGGGEGAKGTDRMGNKRGLASWCNIKWATQGNILPVMTNVDYICRDDTAMISNTVLYHTTNTSKNTSLMMYISHTTNKIMICQA